MYYFFLINNSLHLTDTTCCLHRDDTVSIIFKEIKHYVNQNSRIYIINTLLILAIATIPLSSVDGAVNTFKIIDQNFGTITSVLLFPQKLHVYPCKLLLILLSNSNACICNITLE